MSGDGIILFGGSPWRVGYCEQGQWVLKPLPEAITQPTEIAQALQELLPQATGKRRPVLLALESGQCLSASVPTADLPRKDRRPLMLYRLEEKLPLAAEQWVADFVLGEQDALGVCVPLSQVQPLLAALEERNLQVTHLCPAVLLAQADRMLPQPASCDLVLWQRGSRIDVLTLHQGGVVNWQWIAAESPALRRCVEYAALQGKTPLQIVTHALAGELAGKLESLAGVEVVARDEQTQEDAALKVGRGILCGECEPPVQLRRDALAYAGRLPYLTSPLRRVAAAAGICAVAVALACFWRAHGYQRMAQANEQEQVQLFSQCFGVGEAVPADIPAALAGEVQRLQALRGEHPQWPSSPSAVVLMQRTLAAMPMDLKVRLEELRIASDRIYLQGQARSHGDAEALATALRKTGLFDLEPPRSEQRDDGAVGFTLGGVPAGNKGTQGGGR